MERDLHIWKETHIYGIWKETHVYGKRHILMGRDLKMCIKRDLHEWKETYKYGKRPIYMESDIY